MLGKRRQNFTEVLAFDFLKNALFFTIYAG